MTPEKVELRVDDSDAEEKFKATKGETIKHHCAHFKLRMRKLDVNVSVSR